MSDRKTDYFILNAASYPMAEEPVAAFGLPKQIFIVIGKLTAEPAVLSMELIATLTKNKRKFSKNLLDKKFSRFSVSKIFSV